MFGVHAHVGLTVGCCFFHFPNCMLNFGWYWASYELTLGGLSDMIETYVDFAGLG